MTEKEAQFRDIWVNKDLIIAKKKAVIKHSDVTANFIPSEQVEKVNKSGVEISVDNPNPSVLTAKLVINTTNLIDSHMDCHIPNIWKNTLKQPKTLYLLQEHEMEFSNIIADSVNNNLKAYTEVMPFSNLNYNYKGNTEALIFDVSITKRNEFMFEQYLKGYVLNHSVGMRYIKIYLCTNIQNPEYSSENENWNKYYPMVANKEVADEKGFFWAVTEASIIEGSAVVKGSNECTPVMEIEIEKKPSNDTSNTIEPSNDTQKRKPNILLFN